MSMQLDMFDVLTVYQNGSCDNTEAYTRLGQICKIPNSEWERRKPIGRAEALHSPLKRTVRWHQQTLRRLNLLEPVAGLRGKWQATAEGRKTIAQRQSDLEPATPGLIKLGFSTELGMALWADCRDSFSAIDDEIHCCLTSPPYALAKPRDYGNPKREEFVDWLCACLEPIVKRMADGASIFLNLSNDTFDSNSPARTLIGAELLLTLNRRFGLSMMDTWVWHNPAKAPGPIQWASLRRVQTNTAWEPIYWLTNNPHKCFTDNRRVLKPHTEKHAKYVAAGGSKTHGVYGDGANRRRVGAFSAPTEGAIPRNVLTVRHNCPSQNQIRKWAKENGLPLHSATMPLSIAEHVVKFATETSTCATLCYAEDSRSKRQVSLTSAQA
ncbi:site-specific DNA-methyltransferase (plasmid) [Comamonas aquatica]|nr:site-specific DNA-methyltransferase [Comamonas aquatica]